MNPIAYSDDARPSKAYARSNNLARMQVDASEDGCPCELAHCTLPHRALQSEITHDYAVLHKSLCSTSQSSSCLLAVVCHAEAAPEKDAPTTSTVCRANFRGERKLWQCICNAGNVRMPATLLGKFGCA